MFGFTFKTIRIYVIAFIILLFLLTTDYYGPDTNVIFNQELDDFCTIFSHNSKEIMLRLKKLTSITEPVLYAASIANLDTVILLPVVRILFLVTGFGKYLIVLLLAGFALGRILRFQAIEDFKTPVILKIVGAFSYELVTMILLILIVQAFIACAYFASILFILLPALCGIKIGSAC